MMLVIADYTFKNFNVSNFLYSTGGASKCHGARVNLPPYSSTGLGALTTC